MHVIFICFYDSAALDSVGIKFPKLTGSILDISHQRSDTSVLVEKLQIFIDFLKKTTFFRQTPSVERRNKTPQTDRVDS